MPLTTSSLAIYNLIACLLQLRHLALTTSSLIPYSLLYKRARGKWLNAVFMYPTTHNDSFYWPKQ
ncbi:hypothetical protein HMPREF1991_01336 [Hoylesella loescheii DSM 19665 = JCM 12249 = ATCC 15930]|uniref:Uncharacterized protein n=1 Tax=Hoylesella loescheii DSM 19665 = JCM 12249 = ATCC 15930 TaxID=1122985 RepID=A0A069QIF3_HOYLO|nr:hypothetical protein HMPREF1991_01336 [Hoylesella loescheii DSM 19665 = JCM 12249 = ATCC 15930]